MFLLDSTRSIIAKLLVAAPTTQPDFNTSYSDRNGTSWSEGVNDGVLNDTTEVTIVAAPGVGNFRYVRNIQVHNPNTSQITVIFILANGVNRRVIRQIDVIAKGTVEWDSESGWLTATTQTIINGLTSGIITSGFVGNAAVVSGSIASGQISTFTIASGVITSGLMASGFIAALGTLASGSVQSGNIGNNAVTSGNIASGQVGQFALASGAVNSGQIGNAAVVSGSIASGSISTNAIASGTTVSFAGSIQDSDPSLITSELISGVKAVSVSSSGRIQIAMTKQPTRLPPIGIVTTNIASGQVATIIEKGRIYNSVFNFSGFIGGLAYLSTSGNIIVNQPAPTSGGGFTSGFPLSGTIFNGNYPMGSVVSTSGLIIDPDINSFGQDFLFTEATILQTTTSPSFVDGVVFTTPALTGNYRIHFYCESLNLSTNGITEVNFINTTDNITYNDQVTRFSTTAAIAPVVGGTIVNFTGSAKTFKIQFLQQSGTAQIKNARIEIWRI